MRLSLSTTGRNQSPQLQEQDRELMKGQLLQSWDQLAQVVQRVQSEQIQDRQEGLGQGGVSWGGGSAGLPARRAFLQGALTPTGPGLPRSPPTQHL